MSSPQAFNRKAAVTGRVLLLRVECPSSADEPHEQSFSPIIERFPVRQPFPVKIKLD
jgi:hypothetical protein